MTNYQCPYKYTWFDWFCLSYPPGWLILFNRHWQHYRDDPEGWNWLEYGLFLIPGGYYLALLIRWLRLGCRYPSQEIAEFDPNYQQAFREEILAPIANYYFKVELEQLENLPQTEPLIVAMNHAGMCFPWDFLMLAYLLGRERSWTLQTLAGVSLFEHPWVIWWLPAGWSQVLGGVRAEIEDFEAAIAHISILLYAPEGLRGPRKAWRNRYQLQTFHPSFIRLSQTYKIPILPVVCLGNEYLHPLTIYLPGITRKFKLPFLPISPLMLLLILFPSMGVWASKTRLRYYIQPLYQPWSETENDANVLVKAKNTLYQKAQELRQTMQEIINNLRLKNV